MNLSHRASLILMLVLGLAMLRMWSSGKLTRAWAAINGSPPSSATSSGSSAGSSVGGGLSSGAAGGANQVYLSQEVNGVNHPTAAYPQ